MTRDDCRALVDELNRYPIGFCGPECVGRRERDERLARKHAATERGPRCSVVGCEKTAVEDGRCPEHHARHLRFAS